MLPPIQELVRAETDEEVAIWRERLVTIYQGLLSANSAYSSVVYFRIEGDEFAELVRVERSSRDSSRVRIVPKSRLQTRKASRYLLSVAEMKPDEEITSLESDPLGEFQSGDEQELVLASGVPVYDEKTEYVFGVVMIVCDIQQILRQQFSRPFQSQEVVAVSDASQVILRTEGGQVRESSIGCSLADTAPHFVEAANHLQSNAEFVDESDGAIYGVRVALSPKRSGLAYLLKRK